MTRITRDKTTVVFDRHLAPVATVQPGEVFVVETEDSRSGRTRTPETTTPEFLLEMRRAGYYGNPVTGPIYVDGAEVGDTLAVNIHAQECDTLGYMGYWPFLFHLEEFFDKPDTTLVDIRDGHVIFPTSRGVARIPVRPMIGTIGTTPPVEAVLSGGMGRHGGNLDTQEVCAGSTVYLPVFVEGALLALGDCHAIQSDGELNEVEMRSVVTLSVDVIKGRSPVMSWPRIETPGAGHGGGCHAARRGKPAGAARHDPVARRANRREQARGVLPRRACRTRAPWPGAGAAVLDALHHAEGDIGIVRHWSLAVDVLASMVESRRYDENGGWWDAHYKS